MVSFIPLAFAGTCFVCKAKEDDIDLLECPRCKCISYCSEEHLIADSRFHEQACSKWIDLQTTATEEEYKSNKRRKQNLIADLKRITANSAFKIHDSELHQLCFHKACCVCRSTVTTLNRCQSCQSTFFCNEHLESGKEKHKCDQIELAFACEVLMVHLKHRPSVVIPDATVDWSAIGFRDNQKTTDYGLSINLPKNWSEYFIWRGIPHIKVMSPARIAILSNNYTLPMSIFYVLHQIHVKNSKFFPRNLSKLTVHVIGARLPEVISSSICEEIFHLFPQVKKLNLLLVGPDLSESEYTDEEYTDRPLCDHCQSNGHSLLVSSATGLYHDVIQDYKKYKTEKNKKKNHNNNTSGGIEYSEAFETPNIAIALNAGLWLYDSWKPTVRMLLESKTKDNQSPIFAITTHDAGECDNDIKYMQGMNAQFVLEPFCNDFSGEQPLSSDNRDDINPNQEKPLYPFRGLMPVRRPEDLCDVFYRSSHLFAVSGFIKKKRN